MPHHAKGQNRATSLLNACILVLLLAVPWSSLAPAVWLAAGDRLLARQEFPRAEDAYRRAQAAGAAAEDLHLRAGLLSLACGRLDEAAAAFREAARGRTQAAAWTYLGDAAARRGDLTEALSWWRLALSLGGSAPLQHRIGWAEMRRGHFRQAAEALERSRGAGNRPCLASLGLAALHAHEAPERALGWLREPCQEAPWTDLWTWWPALAPPALDRARLEVALNEAAASDDLVQRAVVLGKAFTALGLPSLAEREWLTVLAHRPQWGTAWAYLGHARARLGKPALEALQRAVFLEPQSEQTWYFLGRWWAANGVPQVAAEAFRKGLEGHPDNLALTLELAFALAAARDYQGASEVLDRAEALADESPATFHLAVGRFYLERLVQVHERGLPAAARALEKAPARAEAHELMGWAAWLTGDGTRAEAELSRAVEMDPLSASAWYHRAAMLAATGRAMAAREAYMRAVVLDPLGFYGARAAKALREMQACLGPLTEGR